MDLDKEIRQILKKNNVLELSELKNLTREDLKNINLDNNQINQVIIYLQLNGFDIKKIPKRSS